MQYFWTFITKLIIDMITGAYPQGQLLPLILTATVIQITATMLNTYYSGDLEWRYIAARLVMTEQKNRKIMSLDFMYLEDSDAMDCYQKASNVCNSNENGIEGMMRQIVQFLVNFAVIAVGFCILGTMNIAITLIMLVMVTLNFLFRNYTNKKCKTQIWDPLAGWWRKKEYLQNMTTDFEAAKDIRMFGLKNYLLEKYRALNKERYEAQKQNGRLWLYAGIFGNMTWFFSQAVLYMWLVRALLAGEMTIGNFSLYLASALTFFSYMLSLLDSAGNLLARSRDVDDFRSFMDFENSVCGSASVPKTASYEFVFEHVSFRYPKAEKDALSDLCITVRAGERLAVVGRNGAGKSTFIKLLLRLYEPTKGRILLNGTDVRQYDKEEYYRLFSPVFQDVNLFAVPLAENVSMKSPDETLRDKARQCLADAGLAEKIAELPKDVDTEILKIIHDDGIDLSGGEKQKLVLARALYKNAPVVVLDEPTAALDALAEAKLYQDFDRLIGDKTAVYISHRLSSTQFCAHVAMFEDGRLLEYGTHEDLLERGGAYADMFRIQAQYYLEHPEADGTEDIFGSSYGAAESGAAANG